jgi:hypothetical protein
LWAAHINESDWAVNKQHIPCIAKLYSKMHYITLKGAIAVGAIAYGCHVACS